MKYLNLSKDLNLPVSTVTQKLAWLGTTGSGKTYGASKLAEEMWNEKAQFIVLDPVGVWYGLRLAEDGKKPSSINIPIFGGLHGDIPLEPTAGSLIADLVVDKNLSCIIDVSQFESDADKTRFSEAFATRFYFLKKSLPGAVHLFIEECQEFVPQNPQKGEERMLHAFIRMQKLGRNFGIGSSYITQRPQEVNKKALNMAQNLFVFRNTGTHERAAIEKWIQDKSLDESIANDLPKIETGTCHIWSPEFLKLSRLIKISKKVTYNASATPEVGSTAKSRELAPIDLEKIKNEMTATIEKTKQEDPELLKKKIIDLEKQLKNSRSGGGSGTQSNTQYSNSGPKNSEDIQKAVKSALAAKSTVWKKEVDRLNTELKKLGLIFSKIRDILPTTLPTIDMPDMSYVSREKNIITPDFSKDIKPGQILVVPDVYEFNRPLGRGPRQIYTYLSRIGIPASKAQISVATGYAPGGGFNNYIYELTALGLIESSGSGSYKAVDPNLHNDLIDNSFDSNVDKWLAKLPLGERKIFTFLRENSHVSYPKQVIAEATGYAYGGGFNNYIYSLSSLGLISKTTDGEYTISPEVINL